MKVLFKLSTMCMLMALLFASCSQSEEIISDTQTDQSLRRADDSPLLITTPSEINFNNSIAGRTYTGTTNVRIAGLPLLAVLSGFETAIQGPADDVFTVITSPPSIGDILGALLGQGIDIEVEYAPFADGQPGDQDEAELVVTASLLGMLMPVQTSVPLIGTIIESTNLVSRTPTGSVVLESPDENDRRQYTVELTFSNAIQVSPDFDIDFSNIVLQGGGGSFDLQRRVESYTVEGNVLSIVISSDNVPASGAGNGTIADIIDSSLIMDLAGNPIENDILIGLTLFRGE